ncbi:MAG TPA: acyl-CoA dehydratase activase [Myxococcota bacterium]|nr:acyl-CoA dehydratase activase [Myxococcota bacterium]
MSYFAGVDVGSAATKCAVIDDKLRVHGLGLCDSGADFKAAAREAFEQAVGQAGIDRQEIAAVVATGYGRTNVDFANERRTEIDCHGRGAYQYFPRAITVIDIGGQDNKVIEIDSAGRRITFSMNRKCAAGTGSFIEEMALRLKIPLDNISDLASRSRDPKVSIGSYCTVFAMTEILGKIRDGVNVEDLVRAALVSVARRVLETMAFTGEVVASGGVVAHNQIMREILSDLLKVEVRLPPDPQHLGAFGAALVAAGS